MVEVLNQKLAALWDALRTKANILDEHQCGSFGIQLPPGHGLPRYQAGHKQYDRFLPMLVTHIDSGTVIDVGANVGDSLAAMISANGSLHYLCVEPDPCFFRLLVSNIERIKAVKSGAKIHSVNALAGRAVTNVALEGSAGTKHAVLGSGTHASRSIDQIVDEVKLPLVRLLKSDVDGFDFDVLDSADAVIESVQPLLYFECQYFNQDQRNSYLRTIERLAAKGYSDWSVFDNFGALMLRTTDLNVLQQLIEYVWHQNLGASTRTIHYFDILACSQQNKSVVDLALAEYHERLCGNARV